MPDWYIRLKADGTPLGHRAAATLPHDRDGNPMFVAAPKAGKDWFKEAERVDEPLGVNQRHGSPVYENLDQPVATIRFPAEDIPAPLPAELSAEELLEMLLPDMPQLAARRPRPKP